MISTKTAIAIVTLSLAAVACGSDKPPNAPSNDTNAMEPGTNTNSNTGTTGSDSSGSTPSDSGTSTGTGSSNENHGAAPTTGDGMGSTSK